MYKIICQVEILTPMFLGGAKQADNDKSICELRTQSIKGVIRYWYRALVGPDRLNGEAELFGSSDTKIGVSKLKIAITDKSNINFYGKSKFDEINQYVFKHPTKGFTINPLNYLAYGVVDNKRQIIRGALAPGCTFKIKLFLQCSNNIQLNDFYKSLYLMLNFGGLGSRSRKGYGATKLLNEEEICNGQDWFLKGDITNTLKNIIHNKAPIKSLYSKEYSYLDTDTRFWLSKETKNTWEECLSMLGKHYHEWRQVLPVADGRENLGTPLLHGKNEIKDRRRASSYFLTVFKINKNEYKYGVLHIPSNYSGNMIPYNVQQEHHAKFQREIEKNADREV